MYLVTGARGNVGKVVASELHRGGGDVRLGVRTPQEGTADEVAFDFTDPSTWNEAFTGVHSMFLVRPPAIGNVKRDLLPAVAAARDAGVKHVVFLSLQGADRNKVVPHATVEKWLRESGLDWTFVRASFFHQNMSTTHAQEVRERNKILVPAGRGATAFVDAHDVGAVAAVAMKDPESHRGRAWTITGPRALTYGQVAETLTDELGRIIRYEKPGALRYIRHARRDMDMPWGMVAVTTAIYTTARLGMAAGLSDDVRTILGRDPIDFTEFAHRERDTWMPVDGTEASGAQNADAR